MRFYCVPTLTANKDEYSYNILTKAISIPTGNGENVAISNWSRNVQITNWPRTGKRDTTQTHPFFALQS